MAEEEESKRVPPFGDFVGVYLHFNYTCNRKLER